MIIACYSDTFFYNPFSSLSNMIQYYCKTNGFRTKFLNINNVMATS